MLPAEVRSAIACLVICAAPFASPFITASANAFKSARGEFIESAIFAHLS
jgi:hypothetical protein